MGADGNSRDEAVGAKGFFIEEETGSHAVINLRVPTFLFQSGRINAKLGEQTASFLAIGERRFDGEGSTVGQQQTSSGTKLVALRVAAEVVVIVENEDASRGTGSLAIEVSGGKTAHARAHDNEVVSFVGVDRRPRRLPESAIAQGVRNFKGSIVTAAHAGESGRIVSRHVLSKGLALGCESESRQPSARERTSRSYGNSIQKIPPSDGAVHAEFAVTGAIGFVAFH